MAGSSAWAEDKITDYANIVSGKKYYIGATTGSTDYYLSVDGSSTSTSIAGTAVTSSTNATPFTFEGSGTSWTIKFNSGYYLSLKDTKDNGKVQVVEDPSTFTVSIQNEKIRLTIGNYSVQKNNNGTQFGSYANTQTDIWLKELPEGAELTCATPTFSPEAGAVFSGTTVSISSTEGATIYYTTNGDDPTTSSSVYSSPIEITTATTIKAFAVKDGMYDSEVATASYTIKQKITDYSIDFEYGLDSYVKWTFNNVGNTNTTITAHGGSKYGANISANGNGTTTASFQTKDKVAYPGTFTCYVSKISTNTTPSNWKIQVSSDGNTWTNVAEQSAISMSKGDWIEFTADIKAAEHNNVYVRLYYDGSSAIRAVDDISLTTYTPAAVEKPRFSLAAGEYYGTQNVALSCTTEDAIIYYANDGTDPTSSSTLYSAPISVTEDMTIKAIAIKGSDVSEIAVATYTITQKDAVQFNIDNQTLAHGSAFTLEADDDYLTDGEVTLTSDNADVVTINGLTITAAAVGTATITVNAAEGATYKAGSTTFNVTVTAPEGQTTAAPSTLTIFEETFASCDGTGGNDDKWSGSIASSTLVADNEGWC